MPRTAAIGAAILMVTLTLVPLVPTAEAGCTDPPGYFIGIVYDSNQHPPRDDFQRDLKNIERMRSTLQSSYCMPSDQVRVFAFRGDWELNGKSYPAATESNLVTAIQDFGAQASGQDDAHLFVMLSSHGLTFPARLCPDGNFRGPLSFSALHGSNLYDCELGYALNQNVASDVRTYVGVSCSFCGGFSDSLTAVSGTVPDNAVPSSSGIPAPNRVVITGCAITTECFGGSQGSVLYGWMDYVRDRVVQASVTYCDGFTGAGFPDVQGFSVPVPPVAGSPANTPDGRCTISELLFSAMWYAYRGADAIAIEQQFRIKYGFDTLQDDILVAS